MQAPIIQLDEETLKGELKDLVRKTVEEVVNGILDAQADEMVNAERYERTDERQAYRSGHYKRGLLTQAGRIGASVPKLRGTRFTSEVIERYRRREESVDEALMEMRLLGVSTRSMEDVTRLLWDEGVSAGTVSNLNQEAFRKVDGWRKRPLTGGYPYVYLDGTYVKRNSGVAYESVAVLVAVGVNPEGFREAIGCEEGLKESADSWRELFLNLGDRGLSGTRMVTGDKASGMLGALAEAFPGAMYQRCTVHFYRNVLAKVPQRRRKAVAAQLKAIHARESLAASARKAKEVAASLRTSKLAGAAEVVEEGYMETLTYARFPPEHWRRIRANNGIERLNRGTKRRTKPIASFPDGKAATLLAAARCKYIAEGNWGSRRYLDINLLDGWDERRDMGV